jgi:hypothetical protein
MGHLSEERWFCASKLSRVHVASIEPDGCWRDGDRTGRKEGKGQTGIKSVDSIR